MPKAGPYPASVGRLLPLVDDADNPQCSCRRRAELCGPIRAGQHLCTTPKGQAACACADWRGHSAMQKAPQPTAPGGRDGVEL